MVRLPGGTYTMLSEVARPPAEGRIVTVAPFLLDVTQVTVAAYGACVRAGKCTPASDAPDFPNITDEKKKRWAPYCNGDRQDRANHPVNCVDWAQAAAYCAWAGKRLPTEEEREWAARGTEAGTKYPWGNQTPRDQLCWDGEGNSAGKGNRQGTCPVGSFPAGDSPQGVKDLVGNVWDLTSSHRPCRLQGDSTDRDCRVSRGGSWHDDNPSIVSASSRSSGAQTARSPVAGIRCAKTL
jgi:formylglycine-generating enzyme required for sulfatase activity